MTQVAKPLSYAKLLQELNAVQVNLHKTLEPYQVNISTAIMSSVASQSLCPGAQKSCLWSRTESCQCSSASQGSSTERRGGFSHRFTFLRLFITIATSFFTLIIKAAVWAAQRCATWGCVSGKVLRGRWYDCRLAMHLDAIAGLGGTTLVQEKFCF